MSSKLPLTELTMYKHGVAHFVRSGRVSGQEADLPLKPEELDDVLGSLVAVTVDGGSITGVQFPTPRSRAERLEDIPIEIGGRHALFDLLRGFRGVDVIVRLEGSRTVAGKVVGLELHPQGRKGAAALLLASEHGDVEQIATDCISSLRIGDEQASTDLAAFLEASRRIDEGRTVRVGVSEPDREVRLSYVAPSPLWRVAYRLVADTSKGQPAALLQAWAIFDNPLDEDLEGVEVRLVAGQPISFRYDLSSSITPTRRTIREGARAGGEPVEFESALAVHDDRNLEVGADAPAFRRRPMSLARMAPAQVEESTLISTTGSDLGDLYEYHLGPVSVKRGGSAMIPIAQHSETYRRELLYNGEKQPSHPVATFALRNTTGLTLERGPVTIAENGQYRGEAILPFTHNGADVRLAYAIELGVTVSEEYDYSETTASVDLEGAILHVQHDHRRRIVHRLANRTDEDKIVTIERSHAANVLWEGQRSPDEESGGYARWSVSCPAQSETAFEVIERTPIMRYERVLDVDFEALSHYLEERLLDADTRSALSNILALRRRISDLETQREVLKVERAELTERQTALRGNLSFTPSSDVEETVRRRSAEAMLQVQDREDQIENEMQRTGVDIEDTGRQLQEAIANLS